jgi:preprotein translocase subunit YajC
MFVLIASVLMIAQGDAPKDQGSIWIIAIPLVVIFALYFFMDSPRRKEQSRRDLMIKNLKKNDRVVTIGGIFGSVVNISTDGKEVTLKVDDSTRIRFRRTAIADVLGDEAAETASKTS